MIILGGPKYRMNIVHDKKGNDSGVDDDQMLEMIADELVNAVHSHDKKSVVDCLRAAFTILSSSEDEEGLSE